MIIFIEHTLLLRQSYLNLTGSLCENPSVSSGQQIQESKAVSRSVLCLKFGEEYKLNSKDLRLKYGEFILWSRGL
jgi:hypothetical protein